MSWMDTLKYYIYIAIIHIVVDIIHGKGIRLKLNESGPAELRPCQIHQVF